MKVKLGMIVESEFGIGKVLAMTKKWVIHDDSINGRDEEFAIYLPNQPISIHLESPDEPDSEIKEVDI